MAQRRMLSTQITRSDAFLNMPLSTQALYMHLNLEADDEGFLDNPNMVRRMIGASEDDIKILIAKRFVLAFDTGILVIKHWHINNVLRKDRIKETKYLEEKKQLALKENNSYTELTTNCLPTVNQMTSNGMPNITEYNITEDNITKGNDNQNNKNDFNLTFEELWSLYPKKKGKSSIKDTTKKKLHKDKENVLKAISNYKAEIERDKKQDQFILNGSTFFNGRYEDYIDLVVKPNSKPKTTSTYQNQRDYGKEVDDLYFNWDKENKSASK